MFGEEKISGILGALPVDFKVRSKKDAEKFLNSVKGTFQVKDLDDKTKIYVITCEQGQKQAQIGLAYTTMEWYDAVIMRSGQDAVDIVYKARKSINYRFFREE